MTSRYHQPKPPASSSASMKCKPSECTLIELELMDGTRNILKPSTSDNRPIETFKSESACR